MELKDIFSPGFVLFWPNDSKKFVLMNPTLRFVLSYLEYHKDQFLDLSSSFFL